MPHDPPRLLDAVATACRRLGYATAQQYLHVTRATVATASPLERMSPA